jgi:phage repressor protein C with HTH and peptisase S24 domain
VPQLRFDAAGAAENFDDAGFPDGGNWKTVSFPSDIDRYSFALEVTDDSLLPVYRRGDRIVISPDSKVNQGDRIVMKKIDGEITVGVLRNQTADAVEMTTLVPSLKSWPVQTHDIEWMSRIVWASQ